MGGGEGGRESILKDREVGHKCVSGTGGREKNGEQSVTAASYREAINTLTHI